MFDILIKQGFDLNILSLFRYKLDLKKDKIATITFLKDDIILNFQFFKNKLIIDSKNRYLDNFLNLIYKNLFKNIRFKNDFVDLYKYLQKKKISKQYMLFFIIFSNYINLEYFKIILLSFKEQYRDILFSYIRKNFNKITFLSVRKNDIVFFKSDKIYKASENIL
jgi:hypothetical protein